MRIPRRRRVEERPQVVRRARYGANMADRERSQPSDRTLPDPIPDTSENIAQAILTTPPENPDDWRYIAEADDG